ncbi:zearalenone lactonase [Hypoxylon sp. FL1284]|nr:zearalenone lactonase [Hypoxylon sp. FL1284]
MSTTASSLALPSTWTISYALTPAPSNPNAPVVILSNSLYAPIPTWDRVVPELTAKGFTVLRYDQPGHGASTVPADLSSTTFESIADDVRTLLNHLSIKQLHAWIGVSMGAATGFVFTAKYPGIVQRLVACNTMSCSPVNAGIDDFFAPMIKEAREKGNMDAAVNSILETWLGRAWIDAHSDEADRVRQLMYTTSIDGFETCCAALRSPTFDSRAQVERAGQGVDKAMLVVGGNDANLTRTMRELREGVERGQKKKDAGDTVELRVIENAGHISHIDGFDDFMAAVLPFLE